jgi:hypothetical protein
MSPNCGLFSVSLMNWNACDENSGILGEISGSHGGEYEDDCLLGCCAV